MLPSKPYEMDWISRKNGDGLVLLLSILCSIFRHLRYPSSKLICLSMIGRVACFGRCADEVILQRLIPLVCTLGLGDQSAPVRALSLRTLRSLLKAVCKFGPSEENIFPSYVFPHLSRVAKDQELLVRVAFAESLGHFAESAKRFLDITHAQHVHKVLSRANENRPDKVSVIDFPYESKFEILKEQVTKWTKELITDEWYDSNQHANRVGSVMKRIILEDILRLCLFFGQDSTKDTLLTQLLTFLNNPEWELRMVFCR